MLLRKTYNFCNVIGSSIVKITLTPHLATCVLTFYVKIHFILASSVIRVYVIVSNGLFNA